MLEEYNPSLKKISMGIIAYQNKGLKTEKLEKKLELINSDLNNKIYLWRGPDTHYDGLLIVENDFQFIIIKKIVLREDLRSTKNFNNILDELQQKDLSKKIMSSEKLKDIFLNWEKKRKE